MRIDWPPCHPPSIAGSLPSLRVSVNEKFEIQCDDHLWEFVEKLIEKIAGDLGLLSVAFNTAHHYEYHQHHEGSVFRADPV